MWRCCTFCFFIFCIYLGTTPCTQLFILLGAHPCFSSHTLTHPTISQLAVQYSHTLHPHFQKNNYSIVSQFTCFAPSLYLMYYAHILLCISTQEYLLSSIILENITYYTSKCEKMNHPYLSCMYYFVFRFFSFFDAAM